MSSPTLRRAERLDAEVHLPVAIVGAGACGLVAALMLHDAGVPCVLLERDATPSGSTALSSGFIPAPGTQLQRSLGLADSPQDFAADIQAKARGTAAAHLVQAYTEAIGPALDALAERHGLPWILLDDFLYPGHHAHRMHTVPEKTGQSLMNRLLAAVTACDIPLVTHALVREMWVNAQDCVIGLGYERPDGSLEHLSCDAVILACNGFGGNAALVQELLPEMRDATFAGHAGNDGSAIAWGRALGAGLADLAGYQGHGSWAVPQGALVSWALMMEGGIQVNARGERFHDETGGYSEAAVAVLAQPGGVVWNVISASQLDFARGFPDFCAAEAAGAVRLAPDVAALAALIGCDEAVLQRTLSAVVPGRSDTHLRDDRVFDRSLPPPYAAIQVTGALFHTQGGLDIDAGCRVRRADGSLLPNLLAAGGAARGVSGNAVWGYLSGNGLLSAVAGGYIAARSAQVCVEALK